MTFWISWPAPNERENRSQNLDSGTKEYLKSNFRCFGAINIKPNRGIGALVFSSQQGHTVAPRKQAVQPIT
jgi:hypothetical protein